MKMDSSDQINSLLSEQYRQLRQSATLAITSEAKRRLKAGEPMIILATGEPDTPPPEHVTKAAAEAATNPELQASRYTPAAGILPLRQKIAALKGEELGTSYSEKNVIVSSGLKPIISTGLRSVLNPGDQVVIPAPFWLSYRTMVEEARGEAVIVQTDAGTDFKMTAQQLKDACTSKTKAFILCSPGNPTGSIYSRAEMEEFAQVLRNLEQPVLTIHDGIYGHLVFPGEEHVWFGKVAADLPVLTVDGFSKSYSVPGWRLGYAVGPESLIEKMVAAQSHLLGNPPSLAQYAAVGAYDDGLEFPHSLAQRYSENAAMILEWSRNQPFVKATSQPKGAFYIWLLLDRDGTEFAKTLLEKAQVAVIPGQDFGDTNGIRISFAIEREKLEEALGRIEKLISSI